MQTHPHTSPHTPPPVAEIELKYQVPAGCRAAASAWVLGLPADEAAPLRLQAAYFDTVDRALARAGMALRIRREGRRWVQTLKGLGSDGLSRAEHELPLVGARVDPADPQVDPGLHSGHPLGDRLLALIQRAEGPLHCAYRTDIRRTARRLRSRHGTVELAFDQGLIAGGGRTLAVCELEIELLSGQPRAVLDVARRRALPLGLWLDTRSKAQRGDMLARGLVMAPPVPARPLRRSGANPPPLGAIIAASRAPLLENASQIADGRSQPGHLAALRTVLRRLTTLAPAALEDPATGAWVTPLTAAAGGLAQRLGTQGAPRDVDVAAALSHPASQTLLLDVLALGLGLPVSWRPR
jgi:triphosphatase